MSTYREIVGKKIKKVSSDPSAGTEGQMWYNSTTGTLRGIAITEAWVSGPAMSEPRATMAGGGTNTSAITSGENGGNPSDAVLAESYNGTGWASETNVPTALGYTNGTGSSSEAYVQAGGGYPSKTGTVLDYDGSSWTSGTAVPGGSPGYIESGMCGPSADALFCGGNNGATTTWERGSGSWTAGGAMANGVYAPTLVGTQTAAISMGGVTYPGGYRDFNQDYNGTAWTSLTVLPAVRGYSGGAGIQTLSMMIGGNSPSSAVATCLEWDSSSWTSIPNLGTARNTMCPMGKTVGTAVATPGNQSSAGTEEFNRSTNTITAAAWASGGTVPYTSRQNMSFGTQTAAIGCGGYVSTTLDTAASYDGTNWTSSPSLNVAARMGGVAGTQGAGLQFGGIQPPGTYNTNVQTWNGSAWANNPLNLSVGTYGLMGCGTQTAALKVGGENPGGGNYTSSEEYDGEGWTAGGALPEAKYVGAGNGIQTSAIITGGSPSGTNTFEYNGSSWTAGGSLMTSRPGTQAGSAGADSDSNIVFGGGPALTTTEGYDGTAWSTRPSLGTGRGSTNGNGIATAGLMVSGGPPSGTTTACEEFTGETSSVNIQNFTTS